MRFRFKEKRQGKTISINGALSLILDEFGITDSVIMTRLRSGWHDIVGNLLAVHSMPDRIFRNMLFVTVDHPLYSNELSLMKGIIIQHVNERFGSPAIKDIRLEVKSIDWQRRKGFEGSSYQ